MRIRNLFKYCLLLIIGITITSCFEIIEEIDLKSDGTGTMTYTFNLSQSKSKLASIMLLDSINGYKVPSRADIQKGLEDVVSELKKAEGITNIRKTADYDNFVFSVKCDFNKMENINKITNQVSNNQKNKTVISSYFFDDTKGAFKRKYVYSNDIKKEYSKLKTENKKVFDDASYTVIYRFDKEVNSQNNPQAKVSKSKKAVMQRVSALDVINGSGNFSTQIQLKK
ncbi:hypothetical protein [Olleya sp. HaHaR_3_96]|uniref:hypothetical protein n=1 Tax=Olleya sp. HaHaR_3_96 TaxID=2745560 RepID=UPI001C4F20ED|nr:hypothetical protein [Olleya sp. HaHaR_3_96]QXP60554.1 hypothetical protein H0I26_02605 [Olleya sp. HaHaR_3_96]